MGLLFPVDYGRIDDCKNEIIRKLPQLSYVDTVETTNEGLTYIKTVTYFIEKRIECLKIHGGNIFQFAHEQRIEPYEVIDFSANINPLGPSQRGLSSLEAQLRYISHYPDATNDDVLNAIADTYGMNKHQIVVGNGAAELLYAICRLPGYTGAFVPAPGFSEYKEALEASRIAVRDIYYRPREDDNGNLILRFLI